MEIGRSEVDLVPTQINQLGSSQAVAIRDEDHSRITVTPPVLLGRIDELVDLGLGQVLAGPQLAVREPFGGPLGGDCSF